MQKNLVTLLELVALGGALALGTVACGGDKDTDTSDSMAACPTTECPTTACPTTECPTTTCPTTACPTTGCPTGACPTHSGSHSG